MELVMFGRKTLIQQLWGSHNFLTTYIRDIEKISMGIIFFVQFLSIKRIRESDKGNSNHFRMHSLERENSQQ